MSTQVTLTATKSAKTDPQNPYVNYSSATLETFTSDYQQEYIGFAALSAAYTYRNLEAIEFYAYVFPVYDVVAGHTNVHVQYSSFGPADGNWSESSITYDNKPYASDSYVTNSIYDTGGNWIHGRITDIGIIKKILNYGLAAKLKTSTTAYTAQNAMMYTSRDSSHQPYAVLTVSDDDSYRYITSASPTSGYRHKQSAITFSWNDTQSGNCLGTLTTANSKFRWRANSSAAATEIDCGTTLSYTMPAGTVTTDSFQWQAQITDSNGHISTSDWYTISTLEALSTASVIGPKNTTIAGNETSTFTWEHLISTGTEQTAADLQYSTNNSTWSSLGTVSGSAKTLTKSANFFQAGQYYWRVRTYNTDNNAGEWSDSASFLVIAAPQAPSVASTQEPRPTISWQGTGQQGYQVIIEGIYDSGTKFGAVYSHKLPIFLNDGSYIVKVKIQNQYGLWSDYGTAPVNVSNTAGPTLTLTGVIDNGDALLHWTEASAYSEFIVYRDGNAIAKVSEYEFRDRFAIGQHSYKVRGIYSTNSNYGISNELTETITVDNLSIYDIESGRALELRLSTTSANSEEIDETATSVLTYISAADYPIVEKSRYKSRTLAFSTAFSRDDVNISAFKSMLGSIVCIKTAKGSMVIGPLGEIARNEGVFYTNFSCTVQQIHWEENITL